MKTIGVATFARSEYSSLGPVMRRLRETPGLALKLYVGGMHLMPEFGSTIREIEADGFPVTEQIPMPLQGDSEPSLVRALGQEMNRFADIFEKSKPDILLIVGDRAELLPVATAATIFRVPIAHISGGDLTEGAVDNQVRYAVSRMSHIHFVSMAKHAERLLRSGEESWRVHVTGDPALDALHQAPLLRGKSLEKELGLPLERPVMVLTYHPATLGSKDAAAEIGEVIKGVETLPGTLILTYPNADANHRVIVDSLRSLAGRRAHTALFASLGQKKYYSVLAEADVIIGNSSSAIWEAPSFGLPAVNIGERQQGRFRAGNVVDVPVERKAIADAVRQALSANFRARLRGMVNPYGDGQAAPRIVEVLLAAPSTLQLLRKKFVEGDEAASVRETKT